MTNSKHRNKTQYERGRGAIFGLCTSPYPFHQNIPFMYIFSLVTTTENDLPTGTYAYARMSSTVNIKMQTSTERKLADYLHTIYGKVSF